MDSVYNLKASVWHLNTVESKEGIWSVEVISMKGHVTAESPCQGSLLSNPYKAKSEIQKRVD